MTTSIFHRTRSQRTTDRQITDSQPAEAMEESSSRRRWKQLLRSPSTKSKLAQARHVMNGQDEVDDFLRGGNPSNTATNTARNYGDNSLAIPKMLPAPRKQPRRPELTVTFDSRKPEIIGEGGDDCDIPVTELKLINWNELESESEPGTEQESDVEKNHEIPAIISPSSGPPNARVNELSVDTKGKPPLTSDPDLLKVLGNNSAANRRLSLRFGDDSNSLAQLIVSKMRMEEAAALHKPVDHPEHEDDDKENNAGHGGYIAFRSPGGDAPSEEQPHAITVTEPVNDNSSKEQYTTPPTPPTPSSPDNSENFRLTPSRNALAKQIEPHQNAFPTTAAPKPRPTIGIHRSGTTATPLKNANAMRKGSAASLSSKTSLTSPITPYSPSLPTNKPSLHNMRSITKLAVEGPVTDFRNTRDTYNDIFANSLQKGPSSSLEDYIRASIWWILRGRGQLESSLRPSAAGMPDPDRHAELQQGVVNLAKASWVNDTLIAKHEEVVQLALKYGLDNNNSSESMERLMTQSKERGDVRMSSLLSLHQKIHSHARALALSMKKNNVIFQPASELLSSSLGSEINLSIWIEYPSLEYNHLAILSSCIPRSLRLDQRTIDLYEFMSFSDTPRFFNFGRMFVNAVICPETDPSDEDEDEEEEDFTSPPIPCILSIARDINEWHVLAFIATQSNLINMVIQGDRRQGPTWSDVRWNSSTFTASVYLRAGLGWRMDIRFANPDDHPVTYSRGKADFHRLRSMVNSVTHALQHFEPREHETVVYDDTLKSLQHMNPQGISTFPAEPSPRCRIRLLEPTQNRNRGFRITCITSPKVKNMSSLTHTFAHSEPLLFAHTQASDDVLILRLHHPERNVSYDVRLAFHEAAELTRFKAKLLEFTLDAEEEKTPDHPLIAYTIEDPAYRAATDSTPPSALHLSFPEKELSPPGPDSAAQRGSLSSSGVSACVMNKSAALLDPGRSGTVNSDNLRMFVRCRWGSVTDRMKLGPGELKIALDPHSMTTFSIYRRAQSNLTVSVASNLVSHDVQESVFRFLRMLPITPTSRRLQFQSLDELHRFQYEITGFKVLFDARASNFAISRRLMIVPIYKKWEAQGTRIQILKQGNVVQLAAFFPADFSHGRCMNFVVKEMDVFETMVRNGGKYGVRIVDAKFALPRPISPATASAVGAQLNNSSPISVKHNKEKNFEEPTRAQGPGEEMFCCLDMPDYPGEHDDITIWFEDENTWREFMGIVPGTKKEASKIGASLRR